MNRIGIDIGSISVNLVVMGETGDILKKSLCSSQRQTMVTKSIMEDLLKEYEIDSVAATGTGAKELFF